MIAHPDIPVASPGLGVRARGSGRRRTSRRLARSRHAEADLAESRARGAALLARMRAVFEDVATRLPSRTPWVAAQLATCEAEFSRLEGTPDPDRWAAAAAALEALQISYDAGYARMREGEATLAVRGDRPRAARALNEAPTLRSASEPCPFSARPKRSRPGRGSASSRRTVETAAAEACERGFRTSDAFIADASCAAPGRCPVIDTT